MIYKSVVIGLAVVAVSVAAFTWSSHVFRAAPPPHRIRRRQMRAIVIMGSTGNVLVRSIYGPCDRALLVAEARAALAQLVETRLGYKVLAEAGGPQRYVLRRRVIKGMHRGTLVCAAGCCGMWQKRSAASSPSYSSPRPPQRSKQKPRYHESRNPLLAHRPMRGSLTQALDEHVQVEAVVCISGADTPVEMYATYDGVADVRLYLC
jgi:hypothetical protein